MRNHDGLAAAAGRDGTELIANERARQTRHQHGRDPKPGHETQPLCGLDLPEQNRRRGERRQREGDAAHIGRTLKARDHDQNQRQQQRNAAPFRVARDQQQRHHHARRRHQMLRRPRCLEQPAGKARGVRHEGPQLVGAENPAKHHADRRGRGKQHDPDRGRGFFAKPHRDTHHQRQRRERGEPRQCDIGFPAGRPQRQRDLGGGKVPQIVVDQPARPAVGAENRVHRRQPGSRHRIDDRDLGMIENRIGEVDRARGEFRDDRHGGRQRQEGCGSERPRRYGRARLGIAYRSAHRPKTGSDTDGGEAQHRERRKSDQKEQRQARRALHRPADHRRRAKREGPRQQMPPQRQSQKRPEDRGHQRAQHGMSGRRHEKSEPLRRVRSLL